jgi:hypothetical protein
VTPSNAPPAFQVPDIAEPALRAQTAEATKEIQPRLQSAMFMNQELKAALQSIRTLPQNGRLTPGPGAQMRLHMAAAAETLGRVLQVPEDSKLMESIKALGSAKTGDVAKEEAFNAQMATLTRDMIAQGGRTSLGVRSGRILSLLTEGRPDLEKTVEGNKRNIASLMSVNLLHRVYFEQMADWIRQRHTIGGFDESFSTNFPVEAFVAVGLPKGEREAYVREANVPPKLVEWLLEKN